MKLKMTKRLYKILLLYQKKHKGIPTLLASIRTRDDTVSMQGLNSQTRK